MSIQSLPIWLIALATILIVLLSIEAGYRLGLGKKHHIGIEKESPVSVISGAILGLLAFMLAFTFGILYNRYDARKALVRTEANAIGTTWLRTSFMSEPDRAKSVKLLKDYVDMRVAVAQSLDIGMMPNAIKATDQIHSQLWSLAVKNARQDMNSDVAALYITSLNEMIDVHGLRVARGFQAKTPYGLWLALYALLILSMLSIGFQTAIAGSKRTLATAMLALSFTVVFVLIASLDQPVNGFFKVSQQPLINLQQTMAGNTVLVKDVME